MRLMNTTDLHISTELVNNNFKMPEIKTIEQQPTGAMERHPVNAIHVMDSRFYPDYADYWDARIFREAVLRHASKDSLVLDLGAGSGFLEQMNFRGAVGKVCGHGNSRSEEHTSELQSPCNLVCRLLLEKKNKNSPSPIV